MSTFTLIDGSGLLFRSYYGLPSLNDNYGTNTQMVFGMAKMTLKFLLEKPDFFAIARDVGGKTARHSMDSEYKANRVQAPDDLIRQIQESHQMIADLGVPAFGFAGYEADDVIATFVRKARQQNGLHTTIISSDKDLKQLINETTDVLDPMKNKRTNYRDFIAEWGFPPQYIADYLALLGDTSDNIPGVFGIGSKGAKTLIRDYHTIDEIYRNLDKLTPSLAQKLKSGQDSAYHSKQLVDLIQVPDMETLSIQHACKLNLNFDTIRYILLDQLQFHSLSKLIDDVQKKHQQVSLQGLFG